MTHPQLAEELCNLREYRRRRWITEKQYQDGIADILARMK